MAPKKKGKGKSKSDDGGGADGDGKKKNAPPTEVEREEMRLKITALEQKLASATARLEAQDAQATEGVALLAQKEKDHKDVMDFIKKELEKRERENASLEKKYILLREAKENEEIRLNHELDVEKATAQMAREQHDLAVSERTRLEEALEEYETLKELRRSNQAQLDTQQGELVSSRAALQQARTQLHILAAPDGDEVSDDGSCALPLLLLEAMRMYSSKPVLQEQACIALQSILSGDSKAECAAVRRHGGVELILDVMRQHEEAGELQSAACGLLWKLSVTDAPTRKLVVKDGGVQLVLAGMTRHLAHPRMQYNACGALRNLVVDNAQNFSVASQIAGARANELPPLHDAPRVRTKATPSHRTPKARTKGGPLRPVRSLPTLRRAERAGHDEAAAGRRPARPDSMNPSPPRRDDLPEVAPAARATVQEQAVALTLHSMREHAGQALVQEYGCGTLWNLMLANAEIKPTIAQADGVALVLECMRAHPKNPGVQLNGAAACKEFVTHPKTLEPMKRLGARKLLEGVMEAHPYNADLLKLAEETLQYLPATDHI